MPLTISRAIAGLVAIMLCAAPLTAHAQATHIGNGQALRVQANVLNLVGVEIGSSVAGPQPLPGSNFAVGPEARAGSVSTLGLNAPNLISGVSNFLSVNASALGATSNGGGGQVTSTASVATVGVNEQNTNLDLGLSVPGIAFVAPAVNLSSFLSLRALRTETFADISGVRTSQTIIEGLSIRNGDGSVLSLSSALAGSGATSTVNADGTLNLIFDDSDSSVSVTATVAGFGNTTRNLATIVLHEKINNPDFSRTTNGIHVTLNSGALTGTLLGTDVVIASSTAGVSAPEPGSLSLIALALGGGVAVRARRRGARKGIMHSKS